MGSLLDEDILEYLLPQRRQGGRQGRDPSSASPMPQPIDGEVSDHYDEPSGDRPRRIDRGGAATQAGEIVFPEPFADYREHVHHVVVVSDEVADCPEDKPPVALDEEIPCGLEIPPLERNSPRLSHISRDDHPSSENDNRPSAHALSRFRDWLPPRHGRAARLRASGFIASEYGSNVRPAVASSRRAAIEGIAPGRELMRRRCVRQGRRPADWNHLPTAVSRFLSTWLSDKWHPSGVSC